MNDDAKTWFGKAYLIGGAAIVAPEYPIPLGAAKDGFEHAQFDIGEPEQIPGPFGAKLVRQRVNLRVRATADQAEDTAMDSLLELVDVAGFATGRRMRVELPGLSDAPPDAAEKATTTIVDMWPIRAPEPRVDLSTAYLLNVLSAVTSKPKKQRDRIIRALRWLRRGSSAVDVVDEFASLTFGYEAIVSLLPDPTREWLSKARKDATDRKNAAIPGFPGGLRSRLAESLRLIATAVEDRESLYEEGAPRAGEVQRHFATEVLRISPEAWRPVGRYRNHLFHGGLTESADVRVQLSLAVPLLRMALLGGIKHVLGIPAADPPSVVSSPVIGRVRLFGPPGLTFQEPTE